MKLYSATRFKSTGSSVQHNTPRLIADDGSITTVGDLRWADNRPQFDALDEGQSSVIAVEQTGIMISIGWRVKRLPDYKHNRVMFDSHAKEYVLVSNGNCVLDHSSSDAFKASHINGGHCHYAASEAIALRAFIAPDGTLSCAWTYRGVNPCDLEPVPARNEAGIRAQFDAALNPPSKRTTKAGKAFVGRI